MGRHSSANESNLGVLEPTNPSLTTPPFTVKRKRVTLLSMPEHFQTALVLLAVWAVLVGATSLDKGYFLSGQTVIAVGFTMALVGVVAVAEALYGMSGARLDLAIPAELIFSAYVVTVLLAHRWNIFLVVVAALVAGGTWGLITGCIIVFGKVTPIIVTLATNLMGVAILEIAIKSEATMPVKSGLAQWGQGISGGLPNVFWVMAALVATSGFLLPRTRLGQHVIAVGGNPVAAKLRGVSLARTRFGVFIVSGVVVGLGGLLLAASVHSFVPADGSTYLLPGIAASLVAGVSLKGGTGNLWILFLSIGFLSTVPVSMSFFGLSDIWQQVPPGAILIVAVAIEGIRSRRAVR